MSGSVSGPSPGGKSRGGIASKGGSAQGTPIDLDMTPMMNMLIILISFLVTMVVFTQLAVIKFNLPPAQGGGTQAAADSAAAKGPEVDITVVVSENGFQIIGEGRKLDPIPKGAKGYDYPRLGQFMKKLKEEYPTSENVVLLIDSNIVYQDIITSMDVMRENKFPNILLSGGVYQ
ncbi:MAG TPA: biopolymer transporter ExbD [Fibrobacteria bacterium]|nr:biopolymer transporter ExbD [Fibrobacteria bacterium]